MYQIQDKNEPEVTDTKNIKIERWLPNLHQVFK